MEDGRPLEVGSCLDVIEAERLTEQSTLAWPILSEILQANLYRSRVLEIERVPVAESARIDGRQPGHSLPQLSRRPRLVPVGANPVTHELTARRVTDVTEAWSLRYYLDASGFEIVSDRTVGSPIPPKDRSAARSPDGASGRDQSGTPAPRRSRWLTR